jgi:diguanylate cyclase (GGDEF)-like protein
MLNVEINSECRSYPYDLLRSSKEDAIFESIDGELCPSAPPPWLDQLGACDDKAQRSLTSHIPFLESFLPEATHFWSIDQDGHIVSDFWTQTDVYGSKVHLLAYAVSLKGKKYLLIRSEDALYREREKLQRYAHETVIQLKLAARRHRELRDMATSLSATNMVLSRLLIQDSLTGIYNRRHFEDILDLEISRATASGEPLSILYMDVDHFKLINDTYGHTAGDAYLRSVGQLLQRLQRRPRELAARIGGEEFGIILPDLDSDSAIQVGQTVNKMIRELRVPHPTSCDYVATTVSIGICTRTSNSEVTMRQMFQAADDALYQAKRAGRDRVVIASAHSDQIP